jgi:hypothetical protein
LREGAARSRDGQEMAGQRSCRAGHSERDERADNSATSCIGQDLIIGSDQHPACEGSPFGRLRSRNAQAKHRDQRSNHINRLQNSRPSRQVVPARSTLPIDARLCVDGARQQRPCSNRETQSSCLGVHVRRILNALALTGLCRGNNRTDNLGELMRMAHWRCTRVASTGRWTGAVYCQKFTSFASHVRVSD